MSIIKSDLHPDDPYPMADVLTAAKFLLTGSAYRSALPDLLSSQSQQGSAVYSRPYVPAPAYQPATQLPIPPVSVSGSAPVKAEYGITGQQDILCAFCGGPGHYASQCEICKQYLAANRAIRGTDGRLYLLGGRWIPRIPGCKGIQGCIDQIEAENAAMSQNPAAAPMSAPCEISGQGGRDPPPHMTAELFSVAEPIDAILEIDPSVFMNMVQVSPSLELTDPEFQPYIAQAWASFQADRTSKDASSAPSKGKRVRFDGVVIPPRTSWSTDPCAASVSEEQEILSPEVQRSSQAAAARSACPATPPVDSRIHNLKATDSSGSNQPSSSMPSSTSSNANGSSSFVPSSQYRYSFPLEDKTASKRMLDNVLAASVEVPVKDLFAVAPDFWKQFREITTTKRIAASTNVVQVNELSGHDPELVECEYGDRILWNDEGLIVAHHNLPLHCIEARISGTEWSLTCVLASGSEVVAMPKCIWQQLGLSI